MNRFVQILLITPPMVLGLFFCIANRDLVTVVLNPFVSRDVAFALSMPLFLVLFFFLGLGVAIGSVSMWFSQQKYRRAARQAQAEVEHLREEAQTYRQLTPQ